MKVREGLPEIPKVDFESGEREPSPLRKLHIIFAIIGVGGFGGLYAILAKGFSDKTWLAPYPAVLISELALYLGLGGCLALLISDLIRRDDLGIGIITSGLMFYLSMTFILAYIGVWTGPDRRDALAEIATILRQPSLERRLQLKLTEVKESEHFVYFLDSPSRLTSDDISRIEGFYRRISSELGVELPIKARVYLPTEERIGINRGVIFAVSLEELRRQIVQMLIYLGPGCTPVQIFHEGIALALEGEEASAIHLRAVEVLKTGAAPPLSTLFPYHKWHEVPPEEIERVKELAGSFVRYLIDRYGLARVKSLFGKSTERATKRAFKKLFEADLPAVEKEWLTFLVTNYSGLPVERALEQPWLDLQFLKIDAKRGKVSERAYLRLGIPPERRWAVLGPIKKGTDFKVESAFALPKSEEDFRARFGWTHEIRWRKHSDGWEEGIVELRVKRDRFSYAFLFLNAQTGGEALIRLGNVGYIKLFLNGKPLIERRSSELRLDEVSIPVELKPGRNPLLVKVGGRGGKASFVLRVTDSEGKGLEGLKFESPLD
ncbi:hypothetical protein DRP77_01910 [Candidatus Poribacteria bacterium]|nr:MAG: hypothetical protein DRP77_01910 [Candidatus Poribacteria bacterium]